MGEREVRLGVALVSKPGDAAFENLSSSFSHFTRTKSLIIFRHAGGEA